VPDTKKDQADGHASAAAREADAVSDVARNTQSQTTAASYTTTDHDVIRAWAEARGGRPASVERTAGDGDAGLLRLEFPDRGDDDELAEVDWKAFFETFEDRSLAFVYQEKTSDGSTSRFSRFINRNSAD
jgi:hypothetical protein